MDERTRKELESYSRGAEKYKINTPARFKWYGYTKEEINEHHIDIVNLIPSHVRSVLEIGCGDGQLAEMIVNNRKDIIYNGFDIVPKNVADARRRLENQNFYVGNYWTELNKPVHWDFVISMGVLFSTTDQKYVPLLFDLLNNASPKGFVVLSLRGSWGIPMKILEEKMKHAIVSSIGLKRYYYRGERDFLPQNLVKRNHPFFIWRENVIRKELQIPETLLFQKTGVLF